MTGTGEELADCRIEAQPIDARRCRFVLDRPLFPNRWAFFAGPTDSGLENAPLVSRLFRIPDIESVLLAHDKVTIARTLAPDLPVLGTAIRIFRALAGDSSSTKASWQRLATQVGSEIRAHIATGEPVVVDASLVAVPSQAELLSRVESVLETDVNPVIAGHGGGVSTVGLIDNVVDLRMSGGCQGCGLADMTLKHGVEAAIRDGVPEIGEIIDLTDHAGGVNPFSKSRKAASPFAKR